MVKAAKSEETRGRILEAAIGLFRRGGFDATTMREIAAEAGVATGAAYYYFDSKDAIVLAFYEKAQQDMESLLEDALRRSRSFEGRLRALIEVKLQYFALDRELLAAMAAHADPAHPLSPFSGRTRDVRERDMKFFERAMAESKVKVTPDLMPLLPGILWMYQMGVILFWVYDRSPGQRRTHTLIEKSAGMVSRLIGVSGFPLLRPVRKAVVELVNIIAG